MSGKPGGSAAGNPLAAGGLRTWWSFGEGGTVYFGEGRSYVVLIGGVLIGGLFQFCVWPQTPKYGETSNRSSGGDGTFSPEDVLNIELNTSISGADGCSSGTVAFS